MDGVRARFDDLSSGAGSFELREPQDVFVARCPAEVARALTAAEDAARNGAWVAGFVAYEAAAGFDGGLPVTHWPPGHPFAELPLVWFAAFRTRVAVPAPVADAGASRPRWNLDRDERWHSAAVERIRNDIASGRYYQLNLTARLTATIDDAAAAYASAVVGQRTPYGALLSTGTYTVASASPELFFERTGRRIVTEPMKGTAARGRWAAEDRETARQLRASPKERAENAMIVDLVRNDLARIADTGTVRVTRLFDTRRYPTVWQLTSTIEASATTGTDLAAAFGALFPSGSVTGAPKRAAMQGIADIERRPRGVYCGAVGYLAPDPQHPVARFAVGIRTITSHDRSGYAEYGTGGGITWPSRPAAEWAELVGKTAVLSSPPRPSTLIETLRFEPARGAVHGHRHLERLASSADFFDLPFSRAHADAALRAALDGRVTPARVRIVLEAAGRLRVELHDLPPEAGTVRLGLAEAPVDSRDVMLFHKHGDRARYDTLRAERRDADDVVLHNERGELTETTIANLAVRLDGRWWTPPLSCGLLPGVERARSLESGALAERVLTAADLRRAEELAVLNSLRGWRSARLIGARDPVPTGRRR